MQKGKKYHFSLLISYFHFSLFAFRFSLLNFLHPLSFTRSVHPSSWRSAPCQVRDLAEELPNWANKHGSFFSSFHHLWATGYLHRALPKGESLYGGDSQAQVFVGSGYSSLPSSSRVNRIYILAPHISICLPINAVGRYFGFDARRDD